MRSWEGRSGVIREKRNAGKDSDVWVVGGGMIPPRAGNLTSGMLELTLLSSATFTSSH